MGAWSGFSLPTPCPLVQTPVNEDLQAVKNFASKPWNVRVSGVSPVPAQSSGAGMRDGHWTEPGSSGKRLVSIPKGRAHLCLDVPVRSQQIFCRNFTAESGAVIRVKTSQVFNTDPFTCVNKQRVRAGFECHNSFFSPVTAIFACERKPCPTLQSLPAPLSFASSLWTNQNQRCWISKDLPEQSFPALMRAELLQHQPGLSKKTKNCFPLKNGTNCEVQSIESPQSILPQTGLASFTNKPF